METTLEEFRKQADKHGICEMSKDWDNCKSKKQLIDLALSIRGIEYIANAVAEGWGISPKQICKEFYPFNNGKYVREKDGYTSALYCRDGHKEENAYIIADKTALLLINIVGKVYVPKNRICEIYAVNSHIKIEGEGIVSIIHCYGNSHATADKSVGFKGVEVKESQSHE